VLNSLFPGKGATFPLHCLDDPGIHRGPPGMDFDSCNGAIEALQQTPDMKFVKLNLIHTHAHVAVDLNSQKSADDMDA
jgi:hypothetical protein